MSLAQSIAQAQEMADWIAKAGELETSHAPVVSMINRREQLYHGRWDIPGGRDPHREYAVDTAPEVVGDRAMDKLTTQEYALTCRTDLSDAFDPDIPLAQGVDPQAVADTIENMKLAARKRADRVEALIRGVMRAIEAQQGWSVVESLAYNAAIDAYAGPARIGYDEFGAAEDGVIPITIQVLDPRSCLIIPESGAGKGPRKVIYKRKAKKSALLEEGWDVLNDNDRFQSLSLETEMTILDCWEKRRIKKGRAKEKQTEIQVWHCIIAIGGEIGQDYLKPPMNMSARGITRIPYVLRPVRRKPWVYEGSEGMSAKGFLDVFRGNWENRNKLLSWQMQMTAQAVNPAVIKKTHQPVDIDVVTPGAQNQVDTDESVEVLQAHSRPEIAAAWGLVETQTQRGTFPAASYGEGSNQLSGIMTGRLQEAGEEPLGATRKALEGALGEIFELVGMFCRVYLKGKKLLVSLSGSEAGPLSVELLSGHEIFDVRLPGLSKVEAAQQAATFKQLSEPRPDGSKWVSDETTREQSKLFPYEHIEEDRIRREQWRAVTLEKIKKEQAESQAMRSEHVADQEAKGMMDINLQREQAAAQRAYQEQQMNQQGPPPPPDPNNPQGVPRTPVQGQPPQPQLEHNPVQPMRGA